MGTLKGEKGFNVQSLASDPVQTSAWTTGGAMNTGRNNAAGMGTATAAWAGGGADDPAGYTNKGEEYNGTAWTEVANLPSSTSYFACAGSQTAGLFFGGTPGVLSQCFKYNGTTFTSSGALATATKQSGGTGIQTLALCMGGEVPAITTITQEFNGSTWAGGGAMVQARNNCPAFGVQADAVVVGGSAAHAPAVWLAETYNGTGWTVGAELNTGREQMANPGAGTASTAGMVAGGGSPTISGTFSNEAESYNGSTWSVKSATLSTKRMGSFGTRAPTTSYLVTGGTPGYLTSTETYSENSEPNTFVEEGQLWYNSTSNVLKFFDGTDIKTITTS